MKGIWTVRVKDAYHAGSGPQAFAIAVSGQGVNDLRPDPQVVLDSMQLNVTIPQVGDQVRLTTNVFNAGNIKAESVDLAFNVNGVELDRKTSTLIQAQADNRHGTGRLNNPERPRSN